jgi:hypothetical protein
MGKRTMPVTQSLSAASEPQQTPSLDADQAEARPQQAASAPDVPRPSLQRSLILDVALPWIAVQILERNGVPVVSALAVAAIFPALSVLVSWLKERRSDVFGIAVLVTLLSGIAVSLLTADPRFAVVKAAPAFALFGLACLASLPAARPLMFFVGRSSVARGDPAIIASWNARIATPGFRRVMRLITLVWGVATLAEAALGLTLAFRLPSETALVVEPLLAIGTVFALLAWTRAFARGRQSAEAEA